MTLLCQFLTATVFKPSSIRLPYTLYHYYDIWCQTLLSIFANSLPRSQLIEQSSWQMFKLGGLPYSGELSTLLEHTVEPRLVPSVYGLPLKTVPFRLPLLGTPSLALPPRSETLLCSTQFFWMYLPLDTLTVPAPLAVYWPVPSIESCTQQWLLLLLEISVQGEFGFGFVCTTEAGVLRSFSLFFSFSPAPAPTPSSLCLCLFSVALCLLCFWQTVYYFVDKCVFQPGQPGQRDG